MDESTIAPALDEIRGLVQADGGDMTLAQALFLRPIPGFAQYHTPIQQLFLCGAATHPGGGVSGLAGKHAAERILGSEH